ncbi:MAG: hypothetical protein K0A98_11815 [Trueperaceae bacterium]|nr:hypothetical protein [Trueperaceae bacterium]
MWHAPSTPVQFVRRQNAPMSAATISAVIALGPVPPTQLDSVQRFLDLVLTARGNYPDTHLEHVIHDPRRRRVMVRVCGPRIELDRLAYALKATFRLEDAELELSG